MCPTHWQSKYPHSNKEEMGHSKGRSDQSKTRNLVEQASRLAPLCLTIGLVIESSGLHRACISSTWAHSLLPVPHTVSQASCMLCMQLSSTCIPWFSNLQDPLVSTASRVSPLQLPSVALQGGDGMGGLWYCHTFSGSCSSLESWDETL